MFIMAKRNLLLPSKDGSNKHPVAKDYIGEIPDWAAETRYFKALVADGKICIPASHKDADLQSEAEKPVKRRKAAEE